MTKDPNQYQTELNAPEYVLDGRNSITVPNTKAIIARQLTQDGSEPMPPVTFFVVATNDGYRVAFKPPGAPLIGFLIPNPIWDVIATLKPQGAETVAAGTERVKRPEFNWSSRKLVDRALQKAREDLLTAVEDSKSLLDIADLMSDTVQGMTEAFRALLDNEEKLSMEGRGLIAGTLDTAAEAVLMLYPPSLKEAQNAGAVHAHAGLETGVTP